MFFDLIWVFDLATLLVFAFIYYNELETEKVATMSLRPNAE